MNAFVRVFESRKPDKAGKKYYAVVVKYDEGKRERLLFDKNETFCALLDCSPNKLASLDCGDYEIE